jgi:hypothetical protein
MPGEVLFGYRHVVDSAIPRCPCGDSTLSAEQPGDDPLVVVLTCWCGRRNEGTFDDLEDRARFIARHGG